MSKILGMMLLMIGAAHFAMATYGAPATPEIGAGSAGSALALISGALLAIRGRRK